MMRAIGLAMIALGGIGLSMSFVDWQPKDGVDADDNMASGKAASGTVSGPLATAVGEDEAVDDAAGTGGPATVADQEDEQRPPANGAAIAADAADEETDPAVKVATVDVSEQSPANVKVFEAEKKAENAEPTLWADIAAASEVVGEDSGYANFLLTLSEPAERSVVIIFSTVNLSAKDEEDYRSQRGTVTFQPGVVSAEIQTPLVDDDIKEDDEQFAIVLNGAPGIVNFKNRRVTATIRDDD